MRNHFLCSGGAFQHFYQIQRCIAFRGQIVSRQFGVTDHSGEDVIKIVRDASGEASDGFQALGALLLFFPHDLVSHVLATGDNAAQHAILIDNRFYHHVQSDLLAVFADHIHFAAPGL